ncbi:MULTISPECIES: transposase [unclassified Streptomyces]|uniref:transposase n=1 Tax=unclassified Streptomyces TaxID=2593676 RepID=UPI0033315809
MTFSTGRLPGMGPGVRLLSQMAAGGPGQEAPRPAARTGPGGRRPSGGADGGDHRFAVSQGRLVGYDGSKKINGRRRHVITDSIGLILMVLVTDANVTDRQAARVMMPCLRARFRKITLVWADGGYTGRLVTWAKEKLQLTLEIVKRSDGMSGFVVLPRRWVVERTLG